MSQTRSEPVRAPGATALAGASGGAWTRRLGLGFVLTYLSVLVLLPIAAIASKAFENGLASFFDEVSSPQAVAALRTTVLISLAVMAINAVVGTMIAWVLVRDNFPGKSFVEAIIDLPFALPTIVASLTLLALYGPQSPVGIDVAYTQFAIALALLFVTLPFTVRSVQPVLMELEKETEEAAASLGAGPFYRFRRVVLPPLLGPILAGAGLGFARSVGEFGSLILISGNIPFKTEVSSVYIFTKIEGDNLPGAAAISVVLLAIALGVLGLISILSYWRSRHVG